MIHIFTDKNNQHDWINEVEISTEIGINQTNYSSWNNLLQSLNNPKEVTQ